MSQAPLIPVGQIERRIYVIRGQKVMLDSDLAELYGVTTGRLNEQVKRNQARFPDDFMFQLSVEEVASLKSQNAISNPSKGGRRRSRPYAFTQEGVAMLSSVLRSGGAIQVNIAIMRVFVRFRQTLASHKTLADKLAQLERRLQRHNRQFKIVFDAIHELRTPEEPPSQQIGFQADRD